MIFCMFISSRINFCLNQKPHIERHEVIEDDSWVQFLVLANLDLFKVCKIHFIFH